MRYTNRLLCVITAVTISAVAYPCIGIPDNIHNIYFFRVTEGEHKRINTDTKSENLRLWQQETSAGIPLSAIEEIVYGDFDAETWTESEVPDSIRSNKFYKWIRSNKATDIEEFLTFAKRVERSRAEKCSPWYYPSKKVKGGGGDGGFSTLIEACCEHKSGKLKARYGLQMMRLLHASCQYEECVSAFNEWFGGISDNNLMKRMAKDYVAGALIRLGDDAPAYAYPMEEIEYALGFARYYDTNVKEKFLPVAYKVVKGGKVSNIGEWEFLVAYLEGEYNDDYATADKYIRKALSHGLSTQTGRDHARAYKMAIDGRRGNIESLLADIKWLENKVNHADEKNIADKVIFSSGYNALRNWRCIMLGIVYGYWFPYLLEHHHLPMAILLSNYVENTCGYTTKLLTSEEKQQMRSNRKARNEIDFNGSLVDFMLSLKPQDLIDYKNCLNDDSKLVAYLRDGGRNDDDFLNEIIGTLYLRECNYIGAYNWLSKVSPGYQYTLNTYKEGYLARDPFAFTRESKMNKKERMKLFPLLRDKSNIKLNFACEMYKLEQGMKHGKDKDTKTIATIKYSLARYASFTSCWALTTYRDGTPWPNHYFYPQGLVINRPGDLFSPYDYTFTRKWSEKERLERTIEEAVASTNAETAAGIQYLLGNLKTIAKRYPDTAVGRFVSSHCDNWKDWI